MSEAELPEASKALLKNYEPLEVDLGTGMFSNVFLFQRRDWDKKRYAVKIMFKEELSFEDISFVNEEVEILAKLDHPNVVRYFESFQDETNLFIVMEYLEESKDLQEMIDKQVELVKTDNSSKYKPLFSEEKVCSIMYMIMTGLHHIHVNKVIHRDLKPQNCMIDKSEQLRIIDFGLSKMEFRDQEEQLVLGTPIYIAPEVYDLEGRNEAYKQPLDCWSAGIIMYFMLAGEFPYKEPNLDLKIQEEPLAFRSDRWIGVNTEAKDLVRKLLEKKPDMRMTAQDSLKHKFFESIHSK